MEIIISHIYKKKKEILGLRDQFNAFDANHISFSLSHFFLNMGNDYLIIQYIILITKIILKASNFVLNSGHLPIPHLLKY